MTSRAAVSLTLGLFLVTLGAASAALADKPAPQTGRVTGPFRFHYLEGAHAGAALCEMGEPDTSLEYVNYITPPNDAYYTLLRASQCPTCVAPDTLLIKFAHIVLEYSVQCIVQAKVSIVAAAGVPGCQTPDTNAVLCPERAVALEPTSSGVFDLVMNMASSCRIAQDAFLCITFMSFGPECEAAVVRPRLVLSSQCAGCESYNEYDIGGGPARRRQDICDDLDFMGKPTMYVEGELCTTPALPTSWGELKIRYR